MRRSFVISATALVLLTATAAGHAQSDETFDAASVGTTADVDTNGVVQDSDGDREGRAAALDESIAAAEARLQNGGASTADASAVAAPPEARAGDYGADDFRAPSDDELSAASEKARAEQAASADDRDTASNRPDEGAAEDSTAADSDMEASDDEATAPAADDESH